MHLNGEAIYNCGYAGFDKQDWGYFTKSRTSDKIYMVVCNVPVSGALLVKLPANKRISQAFELANKAAVLTSEHITGNEYFIHLKKGEHLRPFVIMLETTGSGKQQTEDKAKI